MEFGEGKVIVGGTVLCTNRDGTFAKADNTALEIGKTTPELNQFLSEVKKATNIDQYRHCLDNYKAASQAKGESIDSMFEIQGESVVLSGITLDFGTMIFMGDGAIDEQDLVLDSEQVQTIKDNARDTKEAKEIIANLRGNKEKTYNSLSKEHGGNEINDKTNERMQVPIVETEKATRGTAYLNREQNDGMDGPGGC